jgi:hypothetical protein
MNSLIKKNTTFQIILLSIIIFIIDFLLLKVLNKNTKTFIYSIHLLISFFAILSIIIVILLKQISKKNINNVGFVFLFVTTSKMFFAYLFLKPILNSSAISASSEKINFFIIFILFLAIETTLTIRILNNKQ